MQMDAQHTAPTSHDAHAHPGLYVGPLVVCHLAASVAGSLCLELKLELCTALIYPREARFARACASVSIIHEKNTLQSSTMRL